jgi:tRNA1Val (adenine37-N6)-methyltransferase
MTSKPFQFKRFIVADDHCTHKVGTDGVLLGAWVRVLSTDRFLLDVGTGSGLIALMLAQRSDSGSHIDAVDVGEAEVQQAIDNVTRSPWPEKITLWNTSLQEFSSPGRYDLIVSNPPFFVNSLQPPEIRRSSARHAHSLPFDELLQNVVRLLAPGGRFGVILPYQEALDFTERALLHQLFPSRITSFRARKNKPVERILSEFCFEKKNVESSELVLYEEGSTWSESYKSLTRDFYLRA